MGNYKKKDKHVNIAVGLIMIGISVLLLLILFGVFNPAGLYIKNFFLGSFGLSFYGITVACLLIGVLKLFSFKLSAKISRIIEVVAIYSLFILAFHATSYEYMAMTTSYSEYIVKCYEVADTAGGVFGAIIMYPLLKVNYAFAVVTVALLLFAVLAVTMFGGKVAVNRTRSHSVKYAGKKKKDDGHYEVTQELRNEDIDGNELRDMKKRSRFSKDPIVYTPIEEEEDLSDEDIKVEYKDNYAFSSFEMSNNDTNGENNAENLINNDVNINANNEQSHEDEVKKANEFLYGNNIKRETSSKPLTDNQKFLEAVDRIRNNENNDYSDKYLHESKDDDYELYTRQGRDKIIRDNIRKQQELEAKRKQDELNNLNKNDEISLNNDVVEDSAHIDNDVDKHDDLLDEFNIDDILHEEHNFDDVNDEKIEDVASQDEIVESDEVVDETNRYEIDNFSSSLDKIYPIHHNEENKYDIDQMGNGTLFGDNTVDKREEVEQSDFEGETLDEFEDVVSNTVHNDDVNIEAGQISDFEGEEIDEIIDSSEDKPQRKRRSDFGGTHVSQHPDIATNDNKETEKTDISQFVNPFAGRTQEKPHEVVEEKPVEEQKPFLVKSTGKYKAPPMSLLKEYEFTQADSNDKEIEKQCMLIEENLQSFGIPASVQSVVKGPSFSRIELAMEMGAGKSVKAIKNLASDIEMWLGCNGHVNILAPIPGKSAIGIEIPTSDENRRTVGLKEVFDSPEFNNPKLKIPFALGVDIENKAHVCDVESTPHLLIAGSTGSGKSVGIAAMLNSILYKCSPDEVKLILIDPKKVELNDYEYLPHMLIPKPINDSKQVINALDWLIDEMERRYTTLSEVHASNIGEYNDMVDEQGLPRMPYILLVVDEVADLMLELKKNLEERINKLAAKSRAAGIHIVLATQRPSVDIITGSIKANLPSRLAFATVQQEDSKTILGMVGAEKLLRKGDMLYMDSGSAIPTRIQGAFISKKEVVAITNYVRDNNSSDFNNDILEFIESDKNEIEESDNTSSQQKGSSDEMQVDEKFVEALEAVINAQSASICMLQRKLGIGYPRAGKIYDQLVKFGYIKDKKVQITHMQFMKMFGDQLNGGDGEGNN